MDRTEIINRIFDARQTRRPAAKGKAAQRHGGWAALIPVGAAAEIIGCSPRRVRQLTRAGLIEAVKIGRDWTLRRDAVEAFAKIPRKPGRPPKPSF